MARKRSPLETVFIAWILLHIVSGLLGFGLALSLPSNQSHTAHVDAAIGQVIGYASLGLVLVFLVLLLADGKYLIAACVAALVFGLFPALQTVSRTVYKAKTSSAPRRLPQSSAWRAATRPVVELYGALSAASAGASAFASRQSAAACKLMTPGARAELERGLLGRRGGGGRSACERALALAAQRGVFGDPHLTEAGLLGGLSVSAKADEALFVADNGIQIELVRAKDGDWLIRGFVRATARR
jgi:hypothetical protein